MSTKNEISLGQLLGLIHNRMHNDDRRLQLQSQRRELEHSVVAQINGTTDLQSLKQFYKSMNIRQVMPTLPDGYLPSIKDRLTQTFLKSHRVENPAIRVAQAGGPSNDSIYHRGGLTENWNNVLSAFEQRADDFSQGLNKGQTKPCKEFKTKIKHEKKSSAQQICKQILKIDKQKGGRENKKIHAIHKESLKNVKAHGVKHDDNRSHFNRNTSSAPNPPIDRFSRPTVIPKPK